MNTLYITNKEKEHLLKELESLHKRRPIVLKEKENAMALGDLSENSEYKEAIRMLGTIDGNIARYNHIMSVAVFVDPKTLSSDKIKFGATVKIVDIETDKEYTYQIVSEHGASVESNSISVTSPLGKALIGKKVDDYVEINIPKGFKTYQVIEIKYI